MDLSRLSSVSILTLIVLTITACSPSSEEQNGGDVNRAQVEDSHLHADDKPDSNKMFVSDQESKAIWDQVLTIEDLDQQQREKLFEDTIVFLEKADVTEERFNLASIVAQVVYGNSEAAAGVAYGRIAKIAQKSNDEDVVNSAVRLAGTARRLCLIGKEIAVEGQTIDGKPFDWSEYRGKVVLIDFWGTWCGACIEELPNVQKNYDLYHDRGFEVVGITADTERFAVTEFLKEHKLPWVTLFNPAGLEQPLAIELGVMSTPTVFLVDRRGKVVSLEARGEELSRQLEILLGEPEQPAADGDSAPAEAEADASKPDAANTQSTNIEVITNSIGMRLTMIPAGDFLMGTSSVNADFPSNERPQHRVRITEPFWMGVYEVTQREYALVTGSNPSSTTQQRSLGGDSKDTSLFPVDHISWNAAVSFSNQLSRLEGRQECYVIDGAEVSLVQEDGYRLPTEAEWEYACRAGSASRWHFSDDASQLEHYAWRQVSRTHEVGRKRPNPFGLYDMYGNAWELCHDRYGQNYYTSDSATDPTGPATGDHRVIRGGSWFNGPSQCRSAYREDIHPASHYNNFGFRVVRSS